MASLLYPWDPYIFLEQINVFFINNVYKLTLMAKMHIVLAIGAFNIERRIVHMLATLCLVYLTYTVYIRAQSIFTGT